MEQLIERCAGIDVHQAELRVCVRVPGSATKSSPAVVELIESYGTTTPDLVELRDWLDELEVTHVAMESTGVYWKAPYYALEDRFEVLLVNSNHVKHVPGRKTDTIDAAWLAQLLAHGLLRASFVPPPRIRDLRELTRYRKALIGEHTRQVNRVHKTLEDAGVKLATVASDIMGVSGRQMLRALIAGVTDPDALAELAKGRLRAKVPQLRKALTARFRDHHSFVLQGMLAHIEELESDIEALSVRISVVIAPFADKLELLMTIPGVGRKAAEVIIAETGGDMEVFPTAGHLASWAGVCPGQRESAGRNKSAKTRKGSPSLRTTLTECAYAVSRSKGTYLSEHFRQVRRRRGQNRAIVAISHEILTTAWWLLSTNRPYEDPGPEALHRRNDDHARQRAQRQLERLGFTVTLTPAA